VRPLLLTLALVFLGLPPTATAFEAGDYVLGLSFGQHRAGILVQVFVTDEIALEAYGYSLGFLGAGAVAYTFDDEDIAAVASITRVAGPRLPFLEDAPRERPGAHYALSVGGAIDFGNVTRRANELRGNSGDSFFAAVGPTLRWGTVPPTRGGGFLRDARRLTPFWQLGLKSFYR